MSKRKLRKIMSIALSAAVMLLTLAGAATVSAAESADVVASVVADKAHANPGDEVTYKVVVDVNNEDLLPLYTLQMKLDIPEGMTYVAGSGKVIDGVKTELGFDALDWTEQTIFINGYASVPNAVKSFEVAEFKCTVNDDVTDIDKLALSLVIDESDFQSVEFTTKDFVIIESVGVTPSVITVGEASAETDFTALTEAIKKAEAISADDYTEESYAALSEAIEAAKAVAKNSDATQEEIDSAVKSLEDIIAASSDDDDTKATPDAGEKDSDKSAGDTTETPATDANNSSATVQSEQASNTGVLAVVGLSVFLVAAVAIGFVVFKKRRK